MVARDPQYFLTHAKCAPLLRFVHGADFQPTPPITSVGKAAVRVGPILFGGSVELVICCASRTGGFVGSALVYESSNFTEEMFLNKHHRLYIYLARVHVEGSFVS